MPTMRLRSKADGQRVVVSVPIMRSYFSKLRETSKTSLARKIPKSVRITVGVAAGVTATIATGIGTAALTNHFVSEKFKEVVIVVAAMFAYYQPVLFFALLLLVALLAIALVCGIGVKVYRFIAGSSGGSSSSKDATQELLSDRPKT